MHASYTRQNKVCGFVLFLVDCFKFNWWSVNAINVFFTIVSLFWFEWPWIHWYHVFFLQNNCRIVSCKAYLKKKKNHFTFVIELLFNVHKPFCLHVWCACLSSLMADGHWDSKWISINRSMHICTYMRTVNKMQI